MLTFYDVGQSFQNCL